MRPDRVALVIVLVAAVGLGAWLALYLREQWVGARILTLATTTSMQDSGLLDVLVPPFQAAARCTVKVVAVGSGQALELGKNGDADVLLVHSPTAEKAFMDEGHGLVRRSVMHNDFILLGPPDDPLKLRDLSLAEALRSVAEAGGERQAVFVSRGDDSGTDTKEKSLWKAFGVDNSGPWYQEVGSGMGDTLRLTAERDAYTLSDRGTFLALYGPGSAGAGTLALVFEGSPELLNRYSVIIVDPSRHPDVKLALAQKFVDYLSSNEAHQIIANFGTDRYGQALFWPDYAPGEAGSGRR